MKLGAHIAMYTNIYTEPVPLKYGKLATKCPRICGYCLQCCVDCFDCTETISAGRHTACETFSMPAAAVAAVTMKDVLSDSEKRACECAQCSASAAVGNGHVSSGRVKWACIVVASVPTAAAGADHRLVGWSTDLRAM